MAETSVYVLLVIIIMAAGFAVYILLSHSSSAAKAITTTISVKGNTTTSIYVMATTSTIENQTPSCVSNRTSISVGNFSSGIFYGWAVNGTGFGTAPLNLTLANHKDDYYLNPWSNYEYKFAATTFKSTLAPGTLSTSFVSVEPYLNFQIYSPKSKQLYVEVIPSKGAKIVNYYNTLNGIGTNATDTFAYASINMSKIMCQSVTVKIVSNVTEVTSSNQNLFIAVTGFYQSRSPYETQGINVNFTQ